VQPYYRIHQTRPKTTSTHCGARTRAFTYLISGSEGSPISETVRARIERIVALANPIAIISLGGLVGFLVTGVMLGIFSLRDFAGQELAPNRRAKFISRIANGCGRVFPSALAAARRIGHAKLKELKCATLRHASVRGFPDRRDVVG